MKYNDKSLEVKKEYTKRAKHEFLERVHFYLIPTAQQRIKWLKKKKNLRR